MQVFDPQKKFDLTVAQDEKCGVIEVRGTDPLVTANMPVKIQCRYFLFGAKSRTDSRA